MKVLYFKAKISDTVLFDVPYGMSILWSDGLMSYGPEKRSMWRIRPGWHVQPRRKGKYSAFSHYTPVADEIEDDAGSFKRALRNAFRRLSPWRRARGVMGVVLRDEPFVVHDEESGRPVRLRNVGFFHVLSLRGWDAMYSDSVESKLSVPAPDEWPSRIGNRK